MDIQKINPKISLVMIVKDEEKHLKDCLSSVNDIADEMIIVDTGSADNTKKIALGFNAKVFDLEWRDDFSQARNFGLKQATGDWILHLDADETLMTNTKKHIEFLATSKYWSHYVRIDDSAGLDRRSMIRVFRRDPRIKYAGMIHEQLTFGALSDSTSDQAGPADLVGPSNLVIRHFGYQLSVVEQKDKIKRNLRILQTAYAKDPKDLNIVFHLGREFASSGDLIRAESYYREALALPDITSQPAAPRDLIFCLSEQGKYVEAIEAAKNAEALFPDYTELTFQKGINQFLRQDFPSALESFISCLKKGPDPQSHPSTSGSDSIMAAFFAGICYQQLGNIEVAGRLLDASLHAVANDAKMIEYICMIFIRTHTLEEAAGIIKRIADLSKPDVAAVYAKFFGAL